MKFLKKIERWLDLNVGWFFVNGMKQDSYREYLKYKYGNPNEEGKN